MTQTINTTNTNSVQVALRIRPLTEKDKIQPRFSQSSNSDVLKVYENSVVIVPHQKSFAFDHVLDSSVNQQQVFHQVASNFVDRFIDGYNVTILAYGQTSSGKTYTMGTAVDGQVDTEQEGIIPRAMTALFQKIGDHPKEKQSKTIIPKRSLSTIHSASGIQPPSRSFSSNIKLRPVSKLPPRRGSTASMVNDKSPRYTVSVSFIEIYNEELIDLLNSSPPGERTQVTIREDFKNNIIWSGLKEVQVSSAQDVLKYLQIGTENRTTGSTDMNAQSSRSHAIFSVTLKQEKWVPSDLTKKEEPKPQKTLSQRQSVLNVKELIGQMEKSRKQEAIEESGEWMTVHSKFHFVDLAGSERLKRTAAEGDRRKEGIHINAGLSALGNVISALSDPSNPHIRYRDSKLTRLLQDSLGGNSNTLMIACVSAAEINLNETANTVKYASRARHIKNKAERNEEWMTNENVDYLKQIITKLKAEIKSLRHQRRSPLSSVGSTPSLAPQETHSTSTVDTEPLSSSNSTTLTIPEGCFDNAQILVDLRRQIEELQNELTVTRERNVWVENELKQAEPTIRDYESSIAKLESQLVVTRAALSHSDNALADQQLKITEYESLQENEIRALDELRHRLALALERQQTSENHCNELRCKLEKCHPTASNETQTSRDKLQAEIDEKQAKIDFLESRLQDIVQLKTELSSLRETHASELENMESKLVTLKEQYAHYPDQLLKEQTINQDLREKIEGLASSSESNALETQKAKEESQKLQLQLREQEHSIQITLRQRLEDLERFKLDLRALQQVEEKQDVIIHSLEAKLVEMDRLVSTLREQLEKCNLSIDYLQADNDAKTKLADDMKIQVAQILSDICHIGTEKKQLEHVMRFIENTLRLQDAKSSKTIEFLEDIKQHYTIREEELEKQKQIIALLSDEKSQLSENLKQVSDHASQSDHQVKDLHSQLKIALEKLDQHSELKPHPTADVSNLTDASNSRVHQLEQLVQELQKKEIDFKTELDQHRLDLKAQKVQNQALTHTVSELEVSLKTERALISSQDVTGMISQLESKLGDLQKAKNRADYAWQEKTDLLKDELLSVRQENEHKSLRIATLEESLREAHRQLPPVGTQSLRLVHKPNQSAEVISNDSTNEELAERIVQLQEDNNQLISWNESLESQLVLQRSQLTLETKNLELELMKLTAANERLEKEMEQILPKNNILINNLAAHNEEFTQFTSPPLTPRTPPLVTNTPYKIQRDRSNSSIMQLSRSGTYLSMPNTLGDTDEENKRVSIISSRSDMSSPRPTSSLRHSRQIIISSSSLPPLTAPPSNPLPPIPTPVPHTTSPSSGEPSSPNEALSASPTFLHRHNSGRLSEISMSSYTPEQYDKIFQSLQRKTQNAENDIKAHQSVITKLESQLTRSESSIKEAKKQLDSLNREKEAYNEEIQLLRTQVHQSQDSLNERKELEEELETQKMLREKAEKARRILEDRMEELMNKKSKFMCF
ncbi:hypothetical protein BY458DRAFT_478110 [Sporodiniella umbellata]|nr:hypothetical protein BY458DRAFT_478110 [Sporodiniella umbellata]